MVKQLTYVGRCVWCCGLLLLVAGAAALGESRVRFVVLSFVEHKVQVRMPAGEAGAGMSPRWMQASRNAPIVEGESIRTQVNSVAAVELECGSALRLAPGSELAFNRLRLQGKGVYVTTVTLDQGEAFFTMQDADSRDFHTLLPGAVLSMPHGGAKLRLDVPATGPASVEVLNGRVLVQADGSSRLVHSKRRFVLQPGSLRFTAMLAPDRWQKWSQRQDEAFQRAERNRGPRTPPIFTAPLPSEMSLPDPISGRGWNLRTPTPGPTAPLPESAPLRAAGPPAPYCAHR